MQAWNYDSRMIVAGQASVSKVAGGHMVAGASSQKSVYRSFDEFGGVNQYAGVQGVQFSMASRGRAFGVGLVQAREDQFEYGAPQDYKYAANGFVMYVSEDGAIRIEEKARVGRRRLHADDTISSGNFRQSKATARKLSHQTTAKEAYSQQQQTEARSDEAAEMSNTVPIFCNFAFEGTGHCEQCVDVPDCSAGKLTPKGQAACRATCSSFKSDLPPLNVKKHASCSDSNPCTASNFKVDNSESSEELYISAVCPPGYDAPRSRTAAIGGYATAVGGFEAADADYRRRVLGDPCHFGFAFPGDEFEITVDSATLRVQYWHNGRNIHTSMMVPNFPLLIDAYMIDQGAKVTDMLWKCPPKRCPSGTSSSQCDKMRAKAPAGCNFINENFDVASKATFSPFVQPPRGSDSDGGHWWVWITVVVVVLLFCCCGAASRSGHLFVCLPCCAFGTVKTDREVVIPAPQRQSRRPMVPNPNKADDTRGESWNSRPPVAPVAPVAPGEYWDIMSKLGPEK